LEKQQSCKKNPQLGAQLFLSIFIFINLYMFRATMGPSSGDACVYATLGACYSVCLWFYVYLQDFTEMHGQ